MNKHIKGLLPSGTYHFCVRQSEEQEGYLRLTWTIDVGEYKWRNVIEWYNMDSPPQLSKLTQVFDLLGYKLFDPEHDEFYEQFVGVRSEMKIDIQLKGRFKKNVILEHKLPTIPAEVDVTKEKTDDHFYQNKNKRKLPL